MIPIYLTSPRFYKGTLPLPMIEFSLSANSLNLDGCDTLMFTSKQAVVSAEKIDPRWKTLPAIAIGPATKKQIIKLGGEVIYSPKDYYGSVLAKDIVDKFSNRKLLYLRPKVVSFDSKKYLAQAGITLKEQIIYETNCKSYNDNDKPPRGSIIIFTSPSTIHCFLKNFVWDSSYRAVVIGKATLEHLPPNTKVDIASEPTIDACVNRAFDIAKSLVED